MQTGTVHVRRREADKKIREFEVAIAGWRDRVAQSEKHLLALQAELAALIGEPMA